jgi:hypothetical protein
MTGLQEYPIDYPNPRALNPADYDDAETRQ